VRHVAGDEPDGGHREGGERPERSPPADELTGESAERHADHVGEHGAGAHDAQCARARGRTGDACGDHVGHRPERNAPVAKAVRKRAASSNAKLEPSATMTCPTAKTPKASISVSRLGSRSVSIVISGAPTIIPSAKTMIDSPARATLTLRSPAISGSRPAATNSVVPIRNVPRAST
jgi:hypothetical protein